jgi:breast cancer 2 susceptibility protein
MLINCCFRYERELNSGVRPPLRLVAAQDKPAGLPMVLCVSRIQHPSQGRLEHDDLESGGNDEPLEKPVVEVTDGWYRVRVEVDDAIARAVQRGALRIGTKIGVVGAKVCNNSHSAYFYLTFFFFYCH